MKAIPPYDEPVLLARIAKGDESAFSHLVDQYWNKVYAVAMAYLKSSVQAQDLVQEVFLKVWVKRAGLTEIRNFESWLFIITRNMLLHSLKKIKPNIVATDEVLHELATPAEEHYDYKRLEALLQQGIAMLPPQQQAVFKLSREQGMSHEEIAIELGIAKQTVKNHLVKALLTLRTFIQSYGELGLLIIFTFPNFF